MGDMKHGQHGWYALGRYHACQRKCFGFARDVVEWTAALPHRPLADIAVQVPLAGPVPSWTGAFKSLIVQLSNVEALTIIDNDKKRSVDKYHRHHDMTATATTTATKARQRQRQQEAQWQWQVYSGILTATTSTIHHIPPKPCTTSTTE